MVHTKNFLNRKTSKQKHLTKTANKKSIKQLKKQTNIKQNKKQEIKNKHRDFLPGKNDKKLIDVIE